MTGRRIRAAALGALGVLMALIVATFAGGLASAHDGIESSTPAPGEQLDAPISEATVDFGIEIIDAELALIGPGDEVIGPSETVVVSPTVAKITFPELDREGVYIVRYLAPATDGHTVAGAIQFTYGSAGGSSNTGVILLFCGFAAAVLSVGAHFSWRRYRTLSEPPAADDLADAGV